MKNTEIDIETGSRKACPSLRRPWAPACIVRPAPQSGRRSNSPGGTAAGAAALAMILVLASCSSNSNEYQIPPEAMVARPSSTLAVGDTLRITYSGAEELNQSQKIGLNGRINLPMIGTVMAAGTTLGSLQTRLTSLYEPHLQVPDVQVALEKPAAVVYVSGEVNHAGTVPLDRPMTALEAIMGSGGFSPLANPKQVFVIRNVKGRQQRYVLNLGDTLAGAGNAAFYLRPFDMIYVKRSNW